MNSYKVVKENDTYTFYFHHNKAGSYESSASVRSLLKVYLINNVNDIIFDYLIDQFKVVFSKHSPSTYRYSEYTNVVITSAMGDKFIFEIGKRGLVSNLPLYSVFHATDNIGEKMNINFLPYNNYKCIFKEYIKHFGTINGLPNTNINQKINTYLSKLNGEEECAGDGTSRILKLLDKYRNINTKLNEKCTYGNCNILTCKYDIDNNEFDLYHRHCSSTNDKCFGHLTVKNHELLKCIIEILDVLYNDGIFDTSLGL